MKNRTVQVNGKTYHKDKFEPRSQRCIRVQQDGKVVRVCPLAIIASSTNAKEKPDAEFECALHGWGIKVSAGKAQAICSRKTEATPLLVIQSIEEQKKQNGWEMFNQ